MDRWKDGRKGGWKDGWMMAGWIDTFNSENKSETELTVNILNKDQNT